MKGKAIIVNRVSSKKQDYKLQEKDCRELAKKKGLEVIKVFGEVASAGKSKQKLIFEAEKLAIKEKADIIVWKYDRSFRNKKDFADFMLRMYELHQVKVFSFCEDWINMIWDISESDIIDKIPYPYNVSVQEQLKSAWRLMVRIIGKQAEEEIRDKGRRVKLAVVKSDGKATVSSKGNKWGRKEVLSKCKNKIIELHNQGLSLREISRQAFYFDDNRNKKFPSKSAVQKIVSEHIKGTTKEMAND